MKIHFEGHGAARTFAETESRKNKSELFVVKSHSGGIHYYVTPIASNLAAGEKILEKYRNGIIATGREKESQPILSTAPMQAEMKTKKPLLSILIPTIVDRGGQWASLQKLLSAQLKIVSPGTVEILSKKDNKELSIGEKRELLYKAANGEYSWQIDDDDKVSDNAIDLILKAIAEKPDCITFQEHCTMNGVVYKSNYSLEYGDWEGDGQKEFSDGFHFHRTPFMKSVIKTEIARSVPIPHIRFGEDHQWAKALKPHLKTEIHIPQDIYFYQHTSTDFNERYGINKD